MSGTRGDDGRGATCVAGDERGDPAIARWRAASRSQGEMTRTSGGFPRLSPAFGKPFRPPVTRRGRTFPERRPETSDIGRDARVEVTTWL
jgi:hypothetical protein